jgi:hypothetical protein
LNVAAALSESIRYFRRRARKRARIRGKGRLLPRGVIVVGLFFAVNWVYQAVRKPTEVLTPVSESLAKTPESTWRSYGRLFEKHSTNILSPEFLAALAQIEGSGNPIARTYWRWQWSWNPFEIYRPASSAVGMFQITDGTFAEARKYCIRDGKVATEGPWYDPRSCWFNGLYTRTVPSHAIEMTAAYLHRSVVNITAAAPRGKRATQEQQQRLAAVIHLCGLKRGEAFAADGFRVKPGERCGAHGVARYLNKVDLMKKRFARLRDETEPPKPTRRQEYTL